jgi:hypothetical protein
VSEYQYYEFQAVDRALTAQETAKLRRFSSRATITPRSFVVDYEWGDFKGNASDWMTRYFDGFLYFANWGTHELMLRVPARLLDLDTAHRYCWSETTGASESGEHVLLSFTSECEGCDWEEVEEGALGSILPVREELAQGDHRVLYLAWLLSVQDPYAEGDEEEPPVPPGLRRLTPAQRAFCEFLRVDEDWIAAAAEASAEPAASPGPGEVRAWISSLPDDEKDALLARVAQGEGALVGAELVRRSTGDQRPISVDGRRRTVGQLRAKAERRAEKRLRAAEERRARELARAEAVRSAERARRLDELARTEEQAWGRVEALIATKQPKRYDEAVQLMVDLRDLGVRDGREREVLARIEDVCIRNERKPTLLARIRKQIPPLDTLMD